MNSELPATGEKAVDIDVVWPHVRLICTGVGGVKLGERTLEFGQSVFVPKGTLQVLVLPSVGERDKEAQQIIEAAANGAGVSVAQLRAYFAP